MGAEIKGGMKPMVVAVILANGRPEMVKRAIASFRAQTYENKRLVILASDRSDNCEFHATLLDCEGKPPILATTTCLAGAHAFSPFAAISNEVQLTVSSDRYSTIGALRNFANLGALAFGADLICHWDSDDWSHPARIAEQVDMLRASGKKCVGYRDLLFWESPCRLPVQPGCDAPGHAWRFKSDDPRYLVGASMMYTVEAWRRYPFNDQIEKYEDQDWWQHNNARCLGESAIPVPLGRPLEPRMICGIHGANTSEAYAPEKMRPPAWTHAPEWNAYCADRMRL